MGALELKPPTPPIPDHLLQGQSLQTVEDRVHPSSTTMTSMGSFHSPSSQTDPEAKGQEQGKDQVKEHPYRGQMHSTQGQHPYTCQDGGKCYPTEMSKLRNF